MEVAPDDVPMFAVIAGAASKARDVSDLAVALDLADPTSLAGPFAVWVSQHVFDHLSSWADEITPDTRQNAALKRWLGAPDKGDLQDVLSLTRCVDVLSLVARLCAESGLPKHDTDKVTSRIAARLFGGTPGND